MTETRPLEPASDDLRWLAFRYVAGELNAESAEAFELRLDCDQQAREAVAESVAAVAAVRASGDLALAIHRRHRRLVWMRRMIGTVSTLAAAALALIVSRPWLQSETPDRDPKAKPIPSASAPAIVADEDVALAWSALRDDPDISGATADDAEEMGRDDGETEPDDADSPPSWLAAAFEPGAVQEN